ncbi:hypothetical protein [Chryseobacterium sp. JM1]|uniref:hypothetical protein n=1 Tax=Chryseobacterium sp. JM1 TaxID=1233950 RepID=UPI0004E6B5D8|nr:hypothetical protein [Chryseobacterium sp. JM1]KFF20870.1 hypothetical protein IW22_11170 [Chryseobacterium sp. JM1]
MKKLIILILFFSSIISFGQIDIKIVSLEKSSSSRGEMVIDIINLTNDYYALPLDKKKFKGYNSDELGNEITSFDHPYNFFAPVLLFKDSVANEPLTVLMRSYDVGEDEYLINKINKKDIKERRQIAKWKKENNLQNDFEAKRNMLVMDHLIFLAPKEKMRLKIKLDIFDIRRGDTFFYDYYLLNDKTNYDLSIQLTIDNNVYNYLTDEQKKKFKKYIFFTGALKSNSISFIYHFFN